MQRRQSGAHTRVRTHFVCHTLSPELRSVTLNYSANKTCRPKQRASLPHSLTLTHTHTYIRNVIISRKRVWWLLITSVFINVTSHTLASHLYGAIGEAAFSHASLYPPSITWRLSIWHFDHPFLLAFHCLSLPAFSLSLHFPLASINASVETINKNNDLFKNPQYGSLANEVAGDKLPRLLLTPTCLLIPHVFLNVGSGLYFKMS